MPYTRKPDPVDAIVVGLGATGGTAAKVLSEAGMKVVGFDRGPWLRAQDHYSGDELKFINRNYLWPDPKLFPRTLRHDEDSVAEVFPFSPTPQLVGGGTNHWAGWVPRPRESDFIQRSLHGDLDGANLADWPIRYEHLEPYLTKVEWEFGVSGIAGADKYEPFRSKGYPSQPLRPTRFGKRFYDACNKLGINGFPIPHAMVTNRHKGRDPFNTTSFWNQYGDPSTARSNTLTTFIPEAVATGNFELRPESFVREIKVGKDGRATGVVYIDPDGNEVQQDAEVVILSLGAIESARLMLMSKSPQFPDGLGNSSGQVGKNATFHEYLFAVGLFDQEIDDPLYGWTGNYISGGSFEFYETDESRGHIGGSLISASQTCHPINMVFPGRPTWGEGMKDADRNYFSFAMKIGLILHDMPVESNRVDLDPTVKDAWGLPVARITHKPHPNDVAMGKWQVDKNAEILQAAGARKTIPVYLQRMTGNTCHQHGTARMGTDPAKTVLNEWCQSHDVDNLFVVDGACFPTSTGVNPTLAMMANAWRCSEYIAEVYAKGREEHLKVG
ncbi:GMC family oxidoreductase [Amycolatopsis acidiphila]|uniref:GMC family oxidoreductase n=1 Tax=Amycolatopsis acidiphila TaxID=715473 RepID=A0A558AL52_9PSEU|nr:GMC family oxidoreductase [Amycolatopsis acidiphila]TVT24998.1 GMC family oxidoreductase [Amycolatopsis acidiphila]UIJ57495.1 GMC family oxidoreductase [Amycolatopsis acidiphila]GHG96418.1 gluconate dehydrogenase [Amycolatopsis acidiphila]